MQVRLSQGHGHILTRSIAPFSNDIGDVRAIATSGALRFLALNQSSTMMIDAQAQIQGGGPGEPIEFHLPGDELGRAFAKVDEHLVEGSRLFLMVDESVLSIRVELENDDVIVRQIGLLGRSSGPDPTAMPQSKATPIQVADWHRFKRVLSTLDDLAGEGPIKVQYDNGKLRSVLEREGRLHFVETNSSCDGPTSVGNFSLGQLKLALDMASAWPEDALSIFIEPEGLGILHYRMPGLTFKIMLAPMIEV